MRTILFADDDGAMRGLVHDILAVSGYRVVAVADGRSALDAIGRQPPDLVILDYRMGHPNGFEVCRAIKDDPQLQHLPVLILTGRQRLEDRVRGFAAGANDYLAKPFDPRELVARVKALLSLAEHSRDLNPTTGLPGGPNIEREYARRIGSGEPFALCYLDLDHFKAFNDRFGFAVANTIIAELGHALRDAVTGNGSFAGHVGGDDFVVMCERTEARPLVERVQRVFRAIVWRNLPEDAKGRASFPGRSRSGTDADLPLGGLSGMILHIAGGVTLPLAVLGERAAELKAVTKATAEGGITELEIERA